MLFDNKKIKKHFITVMLSFTLLIPLLSSNVVYADRSDVDSVSFVGENQTEILSIARSANDVVGEEIIVYTGNDGLISFNNKEYSQLTVNKRRDFMETALVATKESGLGNQVKNKVYNFIADQDTTTSSAIRYLVSDASADFAEASLWFKPFGSIFGVALGVLSLFIFMFMGLSIAIDIAYMVLPGFRLLAEGGKEGRPKWVSREAYSSVTESETGIGNGDYKGYMALYFKKRVPSLIAMGIALGYLISGQIYSIVTYIIDAFTSIFTM